MKRFLLAAAATACLALPAIAQDHPYKAVCGPQKKMEAYLLKEHGERSLGGGWIGEDLILAVYVAPDGGTWTVVTISKDGVACLVADGKGWFGPIDARKPPEREAQL